MLGTFNAVMLQQIGLHLQLEWSGFLYNRSCLALQTGSMIHSKGCRRSAVRQPLEHVPHSLRGALARSAVVCEARQQDR